MHIVMEELKEKDSLQKLYDELIENEPKLIADFVPEKQSAIDQKEAFLSGKIRNPNHIYDKLNSIDFDESAEQIKDIGDQISGDLNLNKKHKKIYDDFIENYKQKTQLLSLARQFKNADSQEDKNLVGDEFMKLNIELYGEPDEATYRSLLQEKLDLIRQKPLLGKSLQLKRELFDMTNYNEGRHEVLDRFKPSDETVEWMHDVVDDLYGGMLSRIPDQKKFTPIELKAVFSDILQEEFEGATADWTVDIEPAKSINVKTTEKRIVINEDRSETSLAATRKLVVHELGVHVLRSVMGSDTDIHPLANGISDYYEAEEGIAKVMEQALDGKFVEAGIGHYITAGAAYYDKKDFRDIFEMKWRLGALESVDEAGEVNDEIIQKAKKTAYGETMRFLRGTDELPWLKDLAYYSGTMDMWKYFEAIKGDDIKFTFVLLGKADPSAIEHERILYESKTK